MTNIKTKGIIIRQTDYGESNRMVTIFTDEYGIIKGAAHGAKRMKSRQAAASQFLCYSDFLIYRGNSDVFTINSIEPIDSFFPMQEDIKKLSLGTYICDIIYSSIDTQNPDVNLLRLFLNTLYSISYKNMPLNKAKVVFELRCMACVGFFPVMQQCSVCGAKEGLNHFRIKSGGMVCDSCSSKNDYNISSDMYKTMMYILYANDKKIFLFNSLDEVIDNVGKIAEKYVMYQLDRDFPSLAYYKKMI